MFIFLTERTLIIRRRSDCALHNFVAGPGFGPAASFIELTILPIRKTVTHPNSNAL